MKFAAPKLHRILSAGAAAVLLGTAVLCTVIRLSQSGLGNTFDTMAAETILPGGGTSYTPARASSPARTENSKSSGQLIVNPPHNTEESSAQEDYSSDFESSEPTAQELQQYMDEHSAEAQYPVLEFTSVQGDMAYEGIQVKNSSSADNDIAEELKGRLGFETGSGTEPLVLIYHTHTTEGFLTYDTGYYYESFYPRSKDKTKNVCAIGEEITQSLNSSGIKAIHDTTIHDDPSYTGAYYRSADTVREYLKKYPSIKVVIDIHRDGIGTENSRSKPVCTVNGKKAAQFMIMAGYNCDNDPAFDHWEYNLRLALRLQKSTVRMFPELARPLYFGDFVYNMDINTGSLLIEVGADSNTVEEVRYTGHLLGKVIADVLQEEIKKNKAG